VVDAANPHHGLVGTPSGVVAGELAERSLRGDLARIHLPLQHQLGAGGHGQPEQLGPHHLERLAAVAAGVVVLGEPVAQLVSRGEEQQRVVPTGDEDGARFAAGEVLLPDLPALLAR
jgi:hypothetical protein